MDSLCYDTVDRTLCGVRASPPSLLDGGQHNLSVAEVGEEDTGPLFLGGC